MTLFRHLLRAGANLEATIRRAGECLGRLFLSKAEVAKRASGKLETLKRREMEAERLDRLRNPGDYQGR